MLFGALLSRPEYRTLRAGLAASILAHILLIGLFGARPGWHVPSTPSSLAVTFHEASEQRPASGESSASSSRASTGKESPASNEQTAMRSAQAPGAADAPVELGLTINKYFTARELDVRAEQLNDVALVYPARAYQQRVAGKVLLRLYLSDRGELDRIDLVEASPPGLFEEAALEAAKALRFKPAMLNGRAVRSLKVIEVFFDPYESINVP